MITKAERDLNELALRKIQLADDFLKLNKQLENFMDDYRLNLSKIRLVLGVSATDAVFIDSRDSEPRITVTVSKDGQFLMSNQDKDEEKKKIPKPFGIFEPQCAKNARQDITQALNLICDLATTKNQLNQICTKYNGAKSALANQL